MALLQKSDNLLPTTEKDMETAEVVKDNVTDDAPALDSTVEDQSETTEQEPETEAAHTESENEEKSKDEEVADKRKKSGRTPKKPKAASPKKEKAQPRKKAEVEEDEEEDDDEDEEENPKKGLFDSDPIMEGKRVRAKVERLSVTAPVASPAVKKVEPGKGVALGDIKFIFEQIHKTPAIQLKPLHKLLFGTEGKATVLKKNIRSFSGYPFGEKTEDFEKKMAQCNKFTLDQLKAIKNVLGLHLHGTQVKDALVTTIMAFLLIPVDAKRKIPSKKRKSTASTTAPAAKKAKKEKSKKTTSKSSVDSDDDEEDEEKKESDEEEADKDSDFEEEKPKKQQKKPRTPAAKPQTKAKAKKEQEAEEEDDEEEQEDEPKKADEDDSDTSEEKVSTSNNPTEKELEETITELLATFDLSKVSMKEMCQAVIQKYPNSDLEERKAYLKGKIRKALDN